MVTFVTWSFGLMLLAGMVSFTVEILSHAFEAHRAFGVLCIGASFVVGWIALLALIF